MLNRRLIVLMLVALPMPVLAQTQKAVDKPAAEPPLRAVVHINFAETGQQFHGLKNVANILKAVGQEGAEIEVVCHGGGIGLLEKTRSEHADMIQQLQQQGVKFVACQNTMKSKSISPEDLLPGVGTVPSGAVEVLRKQEQGYSYFKP